MAESHALPVRVLLDHYPSELDNDVGNRLADVLSHVASACVVACGAAVPHVTPNQLFDRVENLSAAGFRCLPPEELRNRLVTIAAIALAMVRELDAEVPLPPVEEVAHG